MSKVSAILPVYNPERYLLDALASIGAQSLSPLEILLIDDGSSPCHAPLIAEALASHSLARLIAFSPNRGVAAARNRGAQEARGEYLAFLDQDDRWAPEKLHLQSSYLDTHPDCAFVTSRQRYFLSDGTTGAPGWVRPEHVDASLPGFLPGTLMVRRAVFLASGGLDESLTAGTDDVDWFFRARASGLITHELPQELLFKRIHQKNLSRNALAHNRELLEVVRRNLARRKAAEEVA